MKRIYGNWTKWEVFWYNLNVYRRKIICFRQVSFFYDAQSISTKSLFIFGFEILRIPPIIWHTFAMMFERQNHKKIKKYANIITKTNIHKKGYPWQKDYELDFDASKKVADAKLRLVEEYLNLKQIKWMR